MKETSKYKGQLSGFPEEVVERMLFYQVGHGNVKDIQVFEEAACSDKENGGFDWNYTSEGYMFWDQVIRKKNFDIFFFYWEKRVVSAKKRGKFLAWKTAETFENSEYMKETKILLRFTAILSAVFSILSVFCVKSFNINDLYCPYFLFFTGSFVLSLILLLISKIFKK